MTKEYTDKDIVVLTDRQHVRLRLPIYAGNTQPTEYVVPLFADNAIEFKTLTFIPAVYKVINEIVDNSLDEFTQISQTNKTLSITGQPIIGCYSVTDNGRGVPISVHSSGKYTPEVVFNSLRSGRNFTSGKAEGVIGQNGIGSSMTCFTSISFEVDIQRDGKRYKQTFTNGGLEVSKPSIRSTSTDKTGTSITFQLDAEVFKDVSLPAELIRNRAIEIALTNPGITVEYNDEKFKYKKGFDDILKSVSQHYYKFESGGLEFYIIFDIHNGIDEQIFSYVNGSLLFDGGICNTQFLNAFYDKAMVHLSKDAKKQKCEITKNDIRQNLLVIGNLKLTDPAYDAQSKTRLTGPNLRNEFIKMIDDEWSSFARKNKDWLTNVLERAMVRHHADQNKKAIKEHQKNSRKKVPGLKDATSENRFETVLLITEGDCLHEDTKIKIANDNIENKHIKDVKIGECVITHTNKIKPIISKTNVVKRGIKINYVGGEIILSEKHKLLVYNKQLQCFEWVQASLISQNYHQLVKSKLGDWVTTTPITTFEKITHSKFSYKVGTYNDVIMCSSTHEFLVFNVDIGNIERIQAEFLNPNYHFMMNFLSSKFINKRYPT